MLKVNDVQKAEMSMKKTKKSVLIDLILKQDKRLAELNQFQCQDHKNMLSKWFENMRKVI